VVVRPEGGAPVGDFVRAAMGWLADCVRGMAGAPVGETVRDGGGVVAGGRVDDLGVLQFSDPGGAAEGRRMRALMPADPGCGVIACGMACAPDKPVEVWVLAIGGIVPEFVRWGGGIVGAFARAAVASSAVHDASAYTIARTARLPRSGSVASISTRFAPSTSI
jgi:hypothetical protein